MYKYLTAFIVASALVQPASAAIIEARATLDGAQEVPPVVTSANGAGLLEIDDATGDYTFSLSVNGLDIADITFGTAPLQFGAAGPVHIHNAPFGSNGPIVLPFPDISNYDDTGGFSVTVSGNITTDANISLSEFINALSDNALYINVHSLASPSGEIRGQLAIVSEPMSLALLGFGLIGLGLARRQSAE